MRKDKLLIRSALAGACAVAALAGCSSPPVPREQLAVGKASVEAAQTAGAAELAPVELTRAREKLAQAQIALRERNLDAARILAEQADADAQVARARANAERSRRAADEVSASLRTLRMQLDKGDTGLMPTAPAAGSRSLQPAPANPDMDPPLQMAPGSQPPSSGTR
ncbi:MAG: DUF4398 domain-containing protein [Aquabacterium sp.]